MKVTRDSMLTGKTHTLDLDVTQEQMALYYEDGELLQNAFPHLPPELREFIKTGITPTEWNEEFGHIWKRGE